MTTSVVEPSSRGLSTQAVGDIQSFTGLQPVEGDPEVLAEKQARLAEKRAHLKRFQDTLIPKIERLGEQIRQYHLQEMSGMDSDVLAYLHPYIDRMKTRLDKLISFNNSTLAQPMQHMSASEKIARLDEAALRSGNDPTVLNKQAMTRQLLSASAVQGDQVDTQFEPADLKRLEAFGMQMVDSLTRDYTLMKTLGEPLARRQKELSGAAPDFAYASPENKKRLLQEAGQDNHPRQKEKVLLNQLRARLDQVFQASDYVTQDSMDRLTRHIETAESGLSPDEQRIPERDAQTGEWDPGTRQALDSLSRPMNQALDALMNDLPQKPEELALIESDALQNVLGSWVQSGQPKTPETFSLWLKAHEQAVMPEVAALKERFTAGIQTPEDQTESP